MLPPERHKEKEEAQRSAARRVPTSTSFVVVSWLTALASPRWWTALLLLGWAMVASAETATGWYEVHTPHVTLKTDLHPEDARRAALAVEHTRAALLAAAWPDAQLPEGEHIEVVVFFSHQDFERYFGDDVGGSSVEGTYPPTAFLYGTPEAWEHRATLANEETTSTLKHELSHHLAAYIYRRETRWFSEGLAQFLETVRLSEDGKTATLGDINPQAMRLYRTHRTTTVDDALAWGTSLNPHDEATLMGLYGQSWLMVYWMYTTHRPEFLRFQKLLVSGLDPTKAWKVVLPPAVSGNIDQQLNHFVRSTPVAVTTSTIPLPERKVAVERERPMTSAEVHATRAQAALAAGQAKEAQTELSAALADDPGNVFALRSQLPLLPPAQRLALGRRATAAHPDDGLAWLALGDALNEGGESSLERAQAYKKATELAPNHPAAFDALAWMALQKGRPAEALTLATTAVSMAPRDPATLDTLAVALASVGRCSEGVAMEARATDMASERRGAPQRAAYASRLAELQKGCAEASPAPATPSTSAPAEPKP